MSCLVVFPAVLVVGRSEAMLVVVQLSDEVVVVLVQIALLE